MGKKLIEKLEYYLEDGKYSLVSNAIIEKLLEDSLNALDTYQKQLEALQWRDIETAPKDGTCILAYAQGWPDVSVIAYQSGKWVGMCDGERSIRAQGDCYTEYHEPFVTHWRPLDIPTPKGE